MSGHDDMTPQVQVLPPDKKKIFNLWKIAGYMAAITTLEFICAFTMDRGNLLIAIFVAMTLWKAYYIVSEFMHLGHEVKPLANAIIMPVIFLLWLILALLMEAQAVYDFIEKFWVDIFF